MGYDLVGLGSRIYGARKNKKMTQDEICEIINVTQPTYSKIENGKYNVTVSLIYQISVVLEVSFVWLIDGSIISEQSDMEVLKLEKNKTYIISIQ
jgi:transcriptional regulator with XRE-family HTH domain